MFKYNFDDEWKNKYCKLKISFYVNDEVNCLVNVCFSNIFIGKDVVLDFLLLVYYVGNYDYKVFVEFLMEMQDIYVCLDNSIVELLELIDWKVGLNNILFFIIFIGYVDVDFVDFF